MTPTLRAALAFAAVSGWLTALLLGHVLGGAIHLLVPVGLVLFPWRAALAREDDAG